MPASGGLASRRGGGQNIKPLSFDNMKSQPVADNGLPTPRTSRSHLLAGLRTAPKSATAATFPASPTTAAPAHQMRNRNTAYGNNDNMYNGPKTSMPRYNQQQTFNNPMMAYAQQQQQQQQQMQQQMQAQHYSADQVLAPPEIQLEDQALEGMDPNLYAQLVATNMFLAQQQQRLQQQLMSVQAAQQQFQTMNLNSAQPMQQAYQNLYQQQQQVNNLQSMVTSGMSAQGGLYSLYDPVTGQQTLYVNQGSAPQLNSQFVDQYNLALQQQQQSMNTPRVQVSPPPAESQQNSFRNPSPPRRFESPADQTTPLPPPSANAFRRGHKKSSSLANVTNGALSVSTQDAPKSAGPKSAHFPLAGTYGPGQGRAGEHPVRQPRGPPSLDELRAKPTSKHEGSKNFATRTRRSAVHNLMRAGITRRQVTGTGSSGSISPISETAEEIAGPLTDDDSDSGRSGSGSLNGDDVECSPPSSRTSTGSWGAIGSDRPSSRQKARGAIESAYGTEAEASAGSFASVFKSANKTPTAESNGQRKAPMLVLTSAEKRKNGPVMVA
ncbi:uncharacterized protein E0L32_011812 [Thyridium curvatum]|uniref:Uncharacterized protein n=1 Tax=Thyridium curvatum TaxID=1093900 RepID=A0A507BMT8_9PEZI|nr:uncharacterized protein E0L32_011812 [Thyridium curvatum]TPX18088.1 hypothetical protein E0L32_011812 [Thyridium curvatum]